MKTLILILLMSFTATPQARIPGPGGKGAAAPTSPTLLAHSGYATGNPAITVGINPTGATFLIGVAAGNGSVCTVSDTNANTWILIATSAGDGTFPSWMWMAYRKAGGALNLATGDVLTLACNGSFGEVDFLAYHGAGGDPRDASNAYSGTANIYNTIQPGSITAAAATISLTQVCGAGATGGGSITGTYAVLEFDPTYGYCTIASALVTGATNPTWTMTGAFHMSAEIASFK